MYKSIVYILPAQGKRFTLAQAGIHKEICKQAVPDALCVLAAYKVPPSLLEPRREAYSRAGIDAYERVGLRYSVMRPALLAQRQDEFLYIDVRYENR